MKYHQISMNTVASDSDFQKPREDRRTRPRAFFPSKIMESAMSNIRAKIDQNRRAMGFATAELRFSRHDAMVDHGKS